MPRMPNYNDPVAGLDERLQRLEAFTPTVATDAALVGQKLDHLTEKVVEGFHTVNSRLDKGADQFEQVASRQLEHQSEIAKLKQAEHARQSRWATIKKSALPLLAAAAGVIATKGGESAWTWLASLLHR